MVICNMLIIGAVVLIEPGHAGPLVQSCSGLLPFTTFVQMGASVGPQPSLGCIFPLEQSRYAPLAARMSGGTDWDSSVCRSSCLLEGDLQVVLHVGQGIRMLLIAMSHDGPFQAAMGVVHAWSSGKAR